MPSTANWWTGEIDWTAPAGRLLEQFLVSLPTDRSFRLTVYGSAPLQLTVDRQLLSGDVDVCPQKHASQEELHAGWPQWKPHSPHRRRRQD
jgi:hypothetical protein